MTEAHDALRTPPFEAPSPEGQGTPLPIRFLLKDLQVAMTKISGRPEGQLHRGRFVFALQPPIFLPRLWIFTDPPHAEGQFCLAYASL